MICKRLVTLADLTHKISAGDWQYVNAVVSRYLPTIRPPIFRVKGNESRLRIVNITRREGSPVPYCIVDAQENNRMNRFVSKLTAAAAGLAVLLLASGVGSQPASAQTPAPTSAAPAGRTITVIGTGTVYTAPDIAYLQVGVDAQNSDLTAALKEVDTKMNAIVTALKTAGIADADIQTVQYSVYRENRPDQPQSGSSSAQPQAIYHAVNIARITVRAPGKTGDVLNAAVNAGANVINSVEFGVKDTKASETNARKAAMDDARAKAGELAANVGGTLGQVIAIDESNGAQPFPRLGAAQGGMGGGGPALSGGSLQVSVQLTVTFELK